MPTLVQLDRLLGPKHAGQFVSTRVRALIHDDLLPPPVAHRLVREGILTGDLLLLAESGQTWPLHPAITVLRPHPAAHRPPGR